MSTIHKSSLTMRYVAAVLACLVVVFGFPETLAAKEKVKIGFIGPLTGGNSGLGLGGRNSADLAVKLRNADPNTKYEYELVALDDECKPNIGIQVATKAGSDREIQAVIAHYCSAVALATVDTYHKFRLPMVTFTAIAPAVTYGNDYKEVHRVIGTAVDENKMDPKFMRALGYKTWGIIHDTTDYGRAHDEVFTEHLQKEGGKVLAKVGVSPDQRDFTAELTKIKALNPEVIYFEGLAPAAVRIRLQMDKLGIDSQYDTVSGVLSDVYLDNLGDLAEGTLGHRIGVPVEELPQGQKFLEQYAAQNYRHPPDVWGHYAFAEANLLMDVIDEVGPDRKKIIKAMNEVKNHPTIVGPVTFDEHGQNIRTQVSMVVVQDGKWLTWGKSEYANGERKLKRLVYDDDLRRKLLELSAQ